MSNSFKPQPITVQHIRTGQIVKAPSVAALSKRFRWGPNGVFHFDNVKKGNRLHHRGWGIPSTLNKTLRLKDVFGNRYQATIRQLATKLNPSAANRLRRTGVVGSLAVENHDFGPIMQPKSYKVIEVALKKGNRVYRGTNKEVAAQTGIANSSVSHLTLGYVPSCRGFRLHEVRTKQRRARVGGKQKEVPVSMLA